MQNINQNIDLNTLKFLYERFRDFLLPFIIILVSIFLFLKVVLPSFFDLLEASEKQKAELLTLRNLENKLSLLEATDPSTIDSQLKIASGALPIDKDFEGFLNAISDASGKSGVSIASFKFTVGNLSAGVEQTVGESQFPAIDIELAINGSSYDVNSFIERLNKILPISEVKEITSGEELSDIKISFYYKILTRSTPDDTLPLSPVSENGLELINELASNFSIPQSSIFDPASTLSAAINPNPFE